MSQLQRSPERGVWFIFDKSRRIAIVRVVEVQGRKLLRSVTFHDDPAQRQLIGYFPEDAMKLAVECTWVNIRFSERLLHESGACRMIGCLSFLAQAHWAKYAPARTAALEDPEEFFRSLGNQVHEQVTALAVTLAGPDLPGEGYLTKAGRLQAARLQAEESVLAELMWISAPEQTPAQAREDWELDRTPDSWLASWAERVQDSPEDQTPATAELTEQAAEWMLPVSFLQELLASPFPAAHLAENRGLLARAADRRYQLTP